MSEFHTPSHEYRTDVMTEPVVLGEYTVGELNHVVDTVDGRPVRFIDTLRQVESDAYGSQVVFPNHNGHLSSAAHLRNAAIRENDPYGRKLADITLAVIALRPVNL